MTLEPKRGVAGSRHFSIAHDPFLKVLGRLHLVRADGGPRTRLLVALAWAPLCLGALARVVLGQRPQPILFDISVHVRLLISIPLLIVGERLLEMRCRGAIDQLYEGNFTDPAAVDRIIDRAERLCASRLAELAIVALALFVGQAALWNIFGPAGLFSGVPQAGSMSFARIWYGTVALPTAQFLMFRWLWHWAIWSYVVIRVSRLPLATISTHPDHAAGLGFLGSPITAFWTFVAAIGSTLAATWGTQLLGGGISIQAFAPSFVGFVVVATVIACGPLLTYMSVLNRARHRDIHRYHGLALDYVREFNRKWIEQRSDEPLLGSQDIQALNDVGGSYENLARTRLVPFGTRMVAGIWIGAVIPMLPLVVSTLPPITLVHLLESVMLGGIPP